MQREKDNDVEKKKTKPTSKRVSICFQTPNKQLNPIVHATVDVKLKDNYLIPCTSSMRKKKIIKYHVNYSVPFQSQKV